MAEDTAAIQQQTTQLVSDTNTITTSVSTLTDADQSVSRSYQTKANQEAAAQEAQKKAAQKGDFTITNADDGYTYRFAFDNATVTKGSVG